MKGGGVGQSFRGGPLALVDRLIIRKSTAVLLLIIRIWVPYKSSVEDDRYINSGQKEIVIEYFPIES